MRFVLIAAICFLTGCQAMIYGTTSSFDRLQLGMEKTQVIDILGRPVSTEVDGDKGEEYLIYKKMKHAISEWPRTYVVTLRNGKVVKWAEQYQETNVNKF